MLRVSPGTTASPPGTCSSESKKGMEGIISPPSCLPFRPIIPFVPFYRGWPRFLNRGDAVTGGRPHPGSRTGATHGINLTGGRGSRRAWITQRSRVGVAPPSRCQSQALPGANVRPGSAGASPSRINKNRGHPLTCSPPQLIGSGSTGSQGSREARSHFARIRSWYSMIAGTKGGPSGHGYDAFLPSR
jgi:hypothetical protein